MKKTNPRNCEREFDFALIVTGVPELTDEVTDALYNAGCDDATLSIQYGQLYIEFSRVGNSIQEAIFSAIRDIDAAIAPSGRTMADFRRILDFGCGCGRVLRTLKSIAPGSALYGTDIDGEAIGWLQKNYGRFGEFTVAPHRPPGAMP